MTSARSIDDLVSVPRPAWPELAPLIAGAAVPARLLLIAPERGREALHRLQVTAASTLGALALNCGGLAVDHGWFRILGGGTPELPGLPEANALGPVDGPRPAPPHVVVAYDVLGGRFAIDGGGLGLTPGNVCYWGPDTLEWEDLGVGHTAFVEIALASGLTELADSLRWPGWQDEIAAVPLDQGLSVYPPPFTAEGRPLENVSRRPVPFAELIDFYDDIARQLH